MLADVTGAFYPVAGLVAHKVVAKGDAAGRRSRGVVADAERRRGLSATTRDASGERCAAEHFGTHVKQSGSLQCAGAAAF